MKNYEELKTVIQAANPEMEVWCKECSRYVKENIAGQCWECNHFTLHRDSPRPIRLADVLLAFNKHYKNSVIDGEFKNLTEWVGDIATQWNLRNDNLDAQSDETKQFLINLLVQ